MFANKLIFIQAPLLESLYFDIALVLTGSLLGRLTGPLYFDSLVLGSLYHGDHLSRAVYRRIAAVERSPALLPPFRLHRPFLSGVSNPEARQPGKAPNFR